MRLIDADALHSYFRSSSGWRFDGRDVAVKIAATPTICCAKCVYGEHRYTLNRCDACHCGDNFEAREE